MSPRQSPAALRLIESVSISTLDPASISVLQDIRVAQQVFEGLFVFNPRGSSPRPGCVREYVVDESKTLYRFQLRDDARWSNGDPVTAEDFRFAWRRAIEPGTAQDYAFFIEAIAGVREYVEWRRREVDRISRLPAAERAAARDVHLMASDVQFDRLVQIRCPDPRTLEVRLARPIAYWTDLLTSPIFLPLHAASVSAYRRVDDSGLIFFDPKWLKPGATAFNGAYVLEEWRFKQGLRLSRNPCYWDRANVRIENAEILDVTDVNTAWLMYEAGRVDWLPSVEATYTPELVHAADSPFLMARNHAGNRRSDIHAFESFGTYFYNLNCQPRLRDGRANPLADTRVRRALTRAIDRQALCENVLRQTESPAVSFVPPGSIEGYPLVKGLTFSPEEARRELAAAGYEDPRQFPEVVIKFNNEANHGLIAQSVASMLKNHLGISVRIEGKESQTYRVDKQNHDFMIARASWYGDYSDPTTFLDTLVSGNGNNDSAFSDPHFDALVRAAEAESHPSRRLRKLAEAEQYAMQEALPILPLFHYVNVYAFRPERIAGLTPHPRLLVLYRDLEILP